MRPSRYRISRHRFPGADPVVLPVPDLEQARRRDGPVVSWFENTVGRTLPELDETRDSLAPVLVNAEGRPVVLDLTEDESWACWWHLLAHDHLRRVAGQHGALFDYLEAGEREAARVALYATVDRLTWTEEGPR